MKKSISFVLVCSLLLVFLSGCSYFESIIGNDDGDEAINVEASIKNNKASTGNTGASNDEEVDVSKNAGEDSEKDQDGIKESDLLNGNCSCTHLVPEGYTGGFAEDPCMHIELGFYWLETYEEVLKAIELLASHGSTVEDKTYGNTVKRSIGFNCEGDFLDVKWCFTYRRSKAEHLEEGKDFFDRRIDDGEFVWFAFAGDVTIDELIYSYYEREEYGSFRVYSPHHSGVPVWYSYIADAENVGNLSLDWFGRYDYGVVDQPLEGSYYEILYQGEPVADMHYIHNYPLPIEYHEEFLSTIVVIE